MDKTTTDPPATSQATTTQPPEDASSIRCQSTEPPELSLAVSCEAADKETVEHKKETYEYIADLTKCICQPELVPMAFYIFARISYLLYIS